MWRWRISALSGAALVGLAVSAALAAEETQDQSSEAAVAAVPAEASAAPRAPARGQEGLDEQVSLDFKSTDVVDALRYLADKGGINLSLSKTVAGRVSLSLANVPIRDVFELILRSNELAYAKQGDIYQVMTEAEYKALYGRRFSDQRIVKAFRLRYAMPEPAFNMLDALKSEIGRLLVDEDSGTVLVMDTPDQIRQMKEALAVLEQTGVMRVFDLKYAKAKDVEERLKDQIELKKLGFVKADERSNQIIVKTLPERMRDVEQLIAALDQKTREVLIDAKIVKINLTDKLDSGIDWDALFTNFKFHGLDKRTDFKTVSTSTVPSVFTVGLGRDMGKLALGTLSNDGFELIRWLETVGETKVIATPRILATDGQEAKIHVGTKEAYVTSTTTTGSSTSTVSEEVKFIDVGIQLSVTPTINTDGYVTMKIKPEVSSVTRTITTPSKSTIPIVDTSLAETNVMVKDGTTIVLGGLSREQKQFENKQIPILGRIPVLGELFRQRDKDDERAELVVFITPHIVTGDEYTGYTAKDYNAQIKPFRDYGQVLEPAGPPPANLPGEALPAPARQPTLPPTARLRDEPEADERPSAPLHLRTQLRGSPAAD